MLGQRAGSDDGRHSFGSCCPEDVAVASVIVTSVQGGAREPQSGFPGGAGAGVAAAGGGVVTKVFKVFSQDGELVPQIQFIDVQTVLKTVEIVVLFLNRVDAKNAFDGVCAAEESGDNGLSGKFVEDGREQILGAIKDGGVQQTVEIPQEQYLDKVLLQFIDKVVDISVVAQRLIPMVLIFKKTTERPRWPMSLLCGSYRFSRAGCG